ncbi:unnamed protein product [Prunus armeniaca]
MDQWKTNFPPIRPPPYKTQPRRPKKSRNKEASEVEVPAPIPPHLRPPNYIPPPAKLRRDQSNGPSRPARGKGKGVHRGAISGGGRGRDKQPSSSSVGDENEKRKIQVAS